jgi:hypothetical protein
MASGADHYTKAEELAVLAEVDPEGDDAPVLAFLSMAHATLALAAVTARSNAANMPALDANQWNQVA